MNNVGIIAEKLPILASAIFGKKGAPVGLSPIGAIRSLAEQAAETRNKLVEKAMLKSVGIDDSGRLPGASASGIISAIAPAIAMGAPIISSDPQKVRNILNVASVVTAIPAIHGILTKAVKATSVYRSLPESIKSTYLEKVVPTMTEHFISAIMPIIMLQSAKHVMSLPQKEHNSTEPRNA